MAESQYWTIAYKSGNHVRNPLGFHSSRTPMKSEEEKRCLRTTVLY
jgi:hypothetical protein